MITHQNICIYQKLLKLIPDLSALKRGTYRQSTVAGDWDLNLDVLKISEKNIIIALSHYDQQDKNFIPDPEMKIQVCKVGFAEALSFQESINYQRVYQDGQVDVTLRKSMNDFLTRWLSNCISQGHLLTEASSKV